MVTNYFQSSGKQGIGDRIISVDFYLFFLILLLGIISIFAMYSSEKGTFGYHTVSHIYRFSSFFLLFIAVSFIKVRVWFKSAYFFILLL